jgi:hypothetical protein
LLDADYRPLTTVVTSAEVRTFRRSALDAERGSARALRRTRNTLFAVCCVAVIVVVCVFIAARLAFDPSAAASAGGVGRAHAIASGTVVLLVLALVVAALILGSRENRIWKHRLRLDAFARANGFGVVFESGAPDYPGALFQGGEQRIARDRLHALTGRALELGRYEYVSPFGGSASRRVWDYVALRIETPLPQIVLEAREHRGKLSTTGVPATYRSLPATQLASATGERFTLYCPPELTAAARGILTTGLIDLLGGGGGRSTGRGTDAAIDVELVDAWMFLYAPAAWDLADPAVLRRLFRIVDAVTLALPDDAGPADDWPGERPAPTD